MAVDLRGPGRHDHLADALRYQLYLAAERPSIFGAFMPPSPSRRQRLWNWWTAHRPHIHLGPCPEIDEDY